MSLFDTLKSGLDYMVERNDKQRAEIEKWKERYSNLSDKELYKGSKEFSSYEQKMACAELFKERHG